MFFYYFLSFLNLTFSGQLVQDLYRILVYQPQLNLLYFLYNLSNQDFGVSVLIIAFLVNLITLPLFAKSFVNTQKTKILRPMIQEIQEKYKTEPQEMLKKLGEFNKKHGLENRSTLLVFFIQIFFISGLFFLIRDVVNNKIDANLYSLFFDQTTASFIKEGNNGVLAFGSIPIEKPSGDYILIPILVGLLSFCYGYYTFKLAPKIELPKLKPKKENKKKTDKEEEEKIFDPEAMQKSMEFQTIYVMPIFLFLIQFTLPVGLGIYMVASSFLSLIRQIFLTKYYSKYTDKLLEKIVQSDPLSKDDKPDNNLEITADPSMMVSDAQITAVMKSEEPKNQNQQKDKSKNKKPNSKNSKNNAKKKGKIKK
jgi:YidC/Oxa1 family membrane protein insertase